MDGDLAAGVQTSELIEGTLLWTGWGLNPYPTRDESIIVRRFGPEVATKLLSAIKDLEEEFYRSDARFVATNLAEMGRISAEQFRRNHPGVAEEIVQAFTWCYTFDFK
jgi:hypothetical protein